MRRARFGAGCAILLLAAIAPGRASAQGQGQNNTSTMTTTYTTLTSTASAADLSATRVLVGYADVSVTACRRNFCRVAMSAPMQPAAPALRYFLTSATNLTTAAALAACTITVPVAATDIFSTTMSVAASRRIYFCYVNADWTLTPVLTLTPSVTFRLTGSNN